MIPEWFANMFFIFFAVIFGCGIVLAVIVTIGIIRAVIDDEKKKKSEKKSSEAGNRTPVVRVTGGNT